MSGPRRWRDDPDFRRETGIDLTVLDTESVAAEVAQGWARLEGVARAATAGPPEVGASRALLGVATKVLRVVLAMTLGGALEVGGGATPRASGEARADGPVLRIGTLPAPSPVSDHMEMPAPREVTIARLEERDRSGAEVARAPRAEVRPLPRAVGEGAQASRLAAEIASYEAALAAERAGESEVARRLYARHLVVFGGDGALRTEVRAALIRLAAARGKHAGPLEK
jgi:hypothetical protein